MMLAMLLTAVTGAWADNEWDAVYTLTQTTSANWTALNAGSTTGKTLGSAGTTTYYYVAGDLSFTNSTIGGSGLTIQGTVYLYIPSCSTLTCMGANASGQTGAGAGVELAENNTLNLLGGGTINATGGDAANGVDGGNGVDAGWDSNNYWSGTGGNGGNGGGGAGAGIGTRGGNGGKGGAGAASVVSHWSHAGGQSGSNGSAGTTANAMGGINVLGDLGLSVNAVGGAAGSSSKGGSAGKSMLDDDTSYNYCAAGGGGGGGGGFGGAACNVGPGGPGGGGGGGGASGNLEWCSSGYYVVKAPGGSGGSQPDGTAAPAGAESILNYHNLITNQVVTNYTGNILGEISYNDSYVSDQPVGSGGTGGAIVGNPYPTLSGAGTEGNPWLINNSADWITLVHNVTNSNSYSGQYVKLAADIWVADVVGSYSSNETESQPFSGTFLGDGHTITTSITDTQNEGTALFNCISGAVIKNLSVAGSITGNEHAAAMVGFATGTGNSIEGCDVTASVSGGTHIGGVLGHSLNSGITISNCLFSGKMTGGTTAKGVFVGWGVSGGNKTVNNCLYLMQDGQNLSGLDLVGQFEGNITVTNCIKTTNAGTYGAFCVANIPDNTIYKTIAFRDDVWYIPCPTSNVEAAYIKTGTSITVNPTVTDPDKGSALNENVDYTFTISPYPVIDNGNYTLTITGKGDYGGTQTFPFIVASDYPVTASTTTLLSGPNRVSENVTINSRINVSGNATLYIDEGVTLLAPKGIELSKGNSLTIEGPGALTINDCDVDKSGIGAKEVGTLTINSGTVNVKGHRYAAGLGGDWENTSGGTITINGGTVKATGGTAAIGGGWWGVCGDIIINGGQVAAYGDDGPGIGPGRSIKTNSGTLRLGWSKPEDFILITGLTNNYNATLNSITFTNGQQFIVEGMPVIATADNLSGKKIVPFIRTINNLSGEGTESAPYIIGSADDWFAFAYNVCNGNDYSGQFVKLEGDITIDQICGFVNGTTQVNPFSGTFLGDGHTITAELTANGARGAAPFGYIKNATIKNLNVAGAINSDQRYTSGLVGFADGTNLIEDCIVTATLNIGTDYAGGIVGHGLESATTIRDCIFAGTVNGIGSSRSNVGGILGRCEGGTPTLVNCLEKGTYNSINSMHPIGLQKDFGSLDNCYYLNRAAGKPDTLCTLSGAYQVYTTPRDKGIDKIMTFADGSTYYLPCTVSGIATSYSLVEGSQMVTPVIEVPYSIPFTLGTDYTAKLNDDDVTSIPLNINAAGTYMLTFTGKGNLTGTDSFTFNVEGTDVFSISTSADWNTFAEAVSNGDDFTGKIVDLIADISVDRQCGVMQGETVDKAFSGTFNGRGHTITATIEDNANQGTALFSYIKDATIKNLTVAGTIASKKDHTSGLVGFADGINVIDRCIVTATLNVGTGYAGGIVGHSLESATTIRDCIFAGTFNGGRNVGGILGWCDGGTPTLVNCFEAGTYSNTSSMHPIGLQKGNGILTDCYFTTPQIGSPSNACTLSGSYRVYASVGENQIYKKVTAVNDNVFYMPCTVSTNDYYTYTGNAIAAVISGIADDGTELSAETDLAYTTSPAAMIETGIYTLTVSGQGDYTGSESFSAQVVEYEPVTSSSTTLTTGEYMVYKSVSIGERINIDGDVVLHLGKGTTLKTVCGIELSEGNKLTIDGEGTLQINLDSKYTYKSGIGAKRVGTLVINGGTVNVTSYEMGSAIGGDGYNETGGSITINGGVVNLQGGRFAAGLGGAPNCPAGDIVINGGQVTALGGYLTVDSGTPSIRGKSGMLTVSWTNPDDFLYCNNGVQFDFSTSASFVKGKAFALDGEQTVATFENLAGKKIVPCWLEGEGTADSPYLIRSAFDWDIFAHENALGDRYEGRFLKLVEDISVTAMLGEFSGTFLGNGHTITANIGYKSDANALFGSINGATIKDLTLAGTINTYRSYSACLVAVANGTNLIDNCTVTATLNTSSDYGGGIVGNSQSSTTTIRNCLFAGTINGDGRTVNVGAIVGWCDGGTPTLANCLEAGTYNDKVALNPVGLQKTTGTIKATNCYYLTPQIGSPYSPYNLNGATQVYATTDDGKIDRKVTIGGMTAYFNQFCTVSGIEEKTYKRGDNVVPTVTTKGGQKLAADTDYIVTTEPGSAQDDGYHTMTVSGTGNYCGTVVYHFLMANYTPVESTMTTLTTGEYEVYEDRTINGRITISGDVVLHIEKNASLYAPKGFELSQDNRLTIEGPGTLTIDNCDETKSGIGAVAAGELVINGGTINVKGGTFAAALGGDRDNTVGGSVTINGGTVNATGGMNAAGIGGGWNSKTGNYGVCGAIAINGGQVTATGGKYAPGVGPGEIMEDDNHNSGSLTIGWTNLDDFVLINGFTTNSGSTLNSIDFADDKQFFLDGTETVATIDNVAGQKIIPCNDDLFGTGTEDNPYVIRSEREWNIFVRNTNEENYSGYSGKLVKLTNDISVTNSAGTYIKSPESYKAFSGIFDGDGHTVEINLSGQSRFGALFKSVKDATIKNLHVTGSIDGTGNSDGKLLAGIVGVSYGTTTITNCRSSVTLTTDLGSDAALAGIVAATKGGRLTITDCVFDGSMTGETNTRCAGIAGYEYNATTTTISNCLFVPAELTVSTADDNYTKTFSRDGDATISHCYYTVALGRAQGTLVYTTAPDDLLTERRQLMDGNDYYIPCTVSDAETANIVETRSASVTPNVTTDGGKVLALGTDYTAKLDGEDVTELPMSFTAMGNHTFTITGTGDSYFGQASVKIAVKGSLDGTGTEDDPYIIRSTDDWNELAKYCEKSIAFDDMYVKLAADITVTTMVGSDGDHVFSGVFLGDGHTLTVDYTTMEEFAAPFHYTDGATIKDLRTAGAINTSSIHAGGVVGRNGMANVTLENVISSVTINSIYNGAAYHGGLMGYAINATMTGCAFTGSLLGVGTHHCGGLLGEKTGELTTSGDKAIITDCLFAPEKVNIKKTGSYTIAGTPGLASYRATITGCYYTEPMDNAQGTQVYTTAPDDLLTERRQLIDGNYYYIPCIVSDVVTANIMEALPISVTPNVTTDDGNVLAFGTDYTAKLDGEDVTELPMSFTNLGNHTLTITGTGNYAGQASVKIVVKGNLDGTGTEDDPYIIRNTYHWNELATYCENGISLDGMYVKLVNDIVPGRMVGTDENHVFSGIFDGDGHTIELRYWTEDKQCQYAAPFRYTYGATIKNLHTTGKISGPQTHASGVVGRNGTGKLTLENVSSDVIITSSHSGGAYIGGLIGYTLNATLTGCAFTGSMQGRACDHFGGLLGQKSTSGDNVVFTDCLFAPALVDIGTTGSYTFAAGSADKTTITGCYYTQTMGNAQGTLARAANSAPANLGDEVKNYGTLTTYENGILYDGTYYVAPAIVNLADADDNSTAISNADGYLADVTLTGRTLYKDGDWNTICLPFDVTIAGSPLAGATARALESASIEGTTLTLTFGDAVTTLEAGTPYIIKWESGDNLVSPVFSGVTIDVDADGSYDNGVSGDERVRFLGTYKSTAFDAEDKSILLMGGENTLYYPTAGAGIGAQRAYFKIGSDGALLARRLTAFNIDFGDDETTGIIAIEHGTLNIEHSADAWFTLDGRRLQGQPTAKGMYIVNGKKVIVK